MKQGRLVLLIIASALLSACMGGIWTGANIVYDRHSVYKKINNYHLFIRVTNALYPDNALKAPGCYLDVTVFNGDVLVVGHLPTPELMQLERQRISLVRGHRRLYNEVIQSDELSSNVQDSWITAKIRSYIFSNDSIDPNSIKILTSDGIVYLMGEVKPDQGKEIIQIARTVSGVRKVVTLMRYYTYQSKKSIPDKN